jgi:hypothetical protein
MLIRQVITGPSGGKARPSAAQRNRAPLKRQAADAASSLNELIAARVEELSPDASDYRMRLLRLVIEAALLHEFGGALLNAPKFQNMVDQVLQDVEASPLMRRDIDDVLDDLTKGRASNT